MRHVVLLLVIYPLLAAGKPGKCSAAGGDALAEFINLWRDDDHAAATSVLCNSCQQLENSAGEARCTELCQYLPVNSGHPQFGQMSWLLLDLLFSLAAAGCPAPKLVAHFATTVAAGGGAADESQWHRAAVLVGMNLSVKKALAVCNYALQQHPTSEPLAILKAHILKRSGKSKDAVDLMKKLFAQTQQQELLHAAFSPRIPTGSLVAKFTAAEVLESIKPAEPLLGRASEYNLLKWELESFQQWGTTEAAPDLKCDRSKVRHDSPAHPKLVVTFPLVASEEKRFVTIGEVWKQYPPCTSAAPTDGTVDLMLLFAGPGKVPKWLREWKKTLEQHVKCFRHIYLSNAGLTQQQVSRCTCVEQ